MPPKKIVFDACDPTRVKMVERSFNAAWSIICSRRVQVGSPREAELRSELARCIQKLAAKGFVLLKALGALLRLVPPIGGSENAVDALFGFGYSVFLPRSQSAQSRLRKEG